MEQDNGIEPEEGKEVKLYRVEESEWLEMALEVVSHYMQQAHDVQELIKKSQVAQDLGLIVEFLVSEEGAITLKIAKKPKLGFIR